MTSNSKSTLITIGALAVAVMFGYGVAKTNISDDDNAKSEETIKYNAYEEMLDAADYETEYVNILTVEAAARKEFGNEAAENLMIYFEGETESEYDVVLNIHDVIEQKNNSD